MVHNSSRVPAICFFVLMSTATAQPRVGKASAVDLAGKRVMFLGDSITAAGGYIKFIEYHLVRRFPGTAFDLIGLGLSSETCSGLSEKEHPFPRPCVRERIERAMALAKPDIVVACYGMNDGIYQPQNPDRLRAFQDGVKKLIQEAHKVNAFLILLTPPPFDSLPVAKNTLPEGAPDDAYSYRRPYVGYDQVLQGYSSWLLTLKAESLSVIDIHGPLADLLARTRASQPQFTFSRDGIHPDDSGHLLMAQELLRGIGLAADAGELDAQYQKIKADPLFALVSRHEETRAKAWLEYVGYTRDKTVKTDTVDPAERAAAAIWRQIQQSLTK